MDIVNSVSYISVIFRKESAPCNYTGNNAHDELVVKAIEMWANDHLFALGYVLLIDVLNELGFSILDLIKSEKIDPRWGWIYRKSDKIDLSYRITEIGIVLNFKVYDIMEALTDADEG